MNEWQTEKKHYFCNIFYNSTMNEWWLDEWMCLKKEKKNKIKDYFWEERLGNIAVMRKPAKDYFSLLKS